MSSAEDESPFRTLPRSIVLKILGSIGWKKPECHLKNARLVCRRWKLFLDHPDFEDREIFDDVISEILKIRGLRLQRIRIEGVSKTDWPPAASIEQFSMLKEICIQMSNSGPTVMTILQCGSETLEKLHISEFSMDKVNIEQIEPVISEIPWTNLTELILETQVLPFAPFPESNENIANHATNAENDDDFNPDEDAQLRFDTVIYCHGIAIEQFLRGANMPKLKKFNFSIQHSWSQEVGRMTSTTMSEFTGFVERHANTLKELKLELCLHGKEIAEFSLMGSSFSAERQDSIANALNLETLEISYGNLDFMKDIVPPFVWKVETLKILTLRQLSDIRTPRPGFHNPFQELIHRCHSTLVQINLWFSTVNGNAFPLQWLEKCFALRKLNIYGHFEDLDPHVRLPQVTNFVTIHATLKIPGDVSVWISQTFENLENLRIYHLSKADIENCQWLSKLLPLVKLQKIQYDCGWDYVFDDESLDYSGPVKGFCEQNSARLVHESDRVHPTIRVLHPVAVPHQL